MLAPVRGPASHARRATVAPTQAAITLRSPLRWTTKRMLTIKAAVMQTSTTKPRNRLTEGATIVGAAP